MMQEDFKLVTINIENRIFNITLNRPEKRNALNSELVSELKTAFDMANDDKASKVVLLKANGKVFSAGADLAYLQQLQKNTYEENLADSNHLRGLFEKIYFHNKVVIAQVEGHAIAGGCGLATVCDFIYSVPKASFGYTEVKIGFVPAIVMIFLIRKIGEAKARELLLSGKLIKAKEALEKGLINKVCEPENIEADVLELAMSICENTSADSIRLTRRMIAEIQHMEINEALDYASENNAKARETADCKKGIAAFLNKEKLTW